MSKVHLFTNFEGQIHKLSFDTEDYLKFCSKGIKITRPFPKTPNYLWVLVANIPAHSKIIQKTNTNQLIDHRDRNPLNNCKDNLRLCDRSQNAANRNKQKTKTRSKYKGVHCPGGRKRKNGLPCKCSKPWQAEVQLPNKKRVTKRFATEVEAAAWYNEQAFKFYGEFAVLNVIE
jgi:hypothetical protein